MANASKRSQRARVKVPATAAPKSEASAAEVLDAPTDFDAPVFDAPAFDAPGFDAPRPRAPEIAETAPAVEAPLAAANDWPSPVAPSVVDGATTVSQSKTAAEEATAAVEASFGAARDGVIALQLKAIEAITAEADAHLDMLASLAGAKSFSDVVTLQTAFARKRFEDAAARAKALAELMRKVAGDTAAPIQAHVAKTFKIAV